MTQDFTHFLQKRPLLTVKSSWFSRCIFLLPGIALYSPGVAYLNLTACLTDPDVSNIDLECVSTSLGWPPNSLVSTPIWDVYLISQVSAMTWCMHAQSLRSCPTVCNPMGHSPPGSSVHGILQARILESIPMPSSRGSSWLKTEPVSPALQADSLQLSHQGSPIMTWYIILFFSSSYLDLVCFHNF